MRGINSIDDFALDSKFFRNRKNVENLKKESR